MLYNQKAYCYEYKNEVKIFNLSISMILILRIFNQKQMGHLNQRNLIENEFTRYLKTVQLWALMKEASYILRKHNGNHK